MNSAIEMPAEVVPLTQQTLLNVLASASSRVPQQIQTGTKQLQEWQTKTSLYSLLQDVFIEQNYPLEIRMLSLLQLKNGVDKYWRKNAINAIDTKERDLVRSRVLSTGVNEPNQQLVALNAIIVAKIARHDFPLAWPSMISDVIQLIRTSSHRQLLSALQISLQIIKELSTVRVARMKSSLYSVSAEWLSVLVDVYQQSVHQWSNSLHGDANVVSEQMIISEKCLKTIRRLVVAGFELPGNDTGVQSFWATSNSHLHEFFKLLTSGPPAVFKIEIIKHMVQFAKFHLNMASDHQLSFAKLPDSCDLARTYWQYSTTIRTQSKSFDDDSDANPEETQLQSLCLRGLLLMRACFKLVFQPTSSLQYKNKDVRAELDQGKAFIQNSLLTDDFVSEMFRTLVEKFFFLNQQDVEEWVSDAEEWEIQVEGGDAAYEHSVRPCAERLFLDIALNCKDLIIDALLTIVAQISDPQFVDPWTKDAVYNALGLAAPILHTRFDFNSFLTTTIARDLQQSSPDYNIVRRRISILVAQWSPIDISEANRPFVNQTFEHLLDKNQELNNLTVRMTAGKQFRTVADAWNFRPDTFAPFASSILSALIDLIQEVDLIETKMALLSTVTALVERLEKQAIPFADHIVSLLPPLWEQSGQEHLMKQGIVAVLVQLVNALGSQSTPLHPLVIPIISSALEPGSETRVYLLDDAIDLWRAILAQTSSPASPELLSIARYLYPLYDMELEILDRALRLTESYIMLAPNEMLQDDHRRTLLACFDKYLGSKKPWINDSITRILELMIRAADDIGGMPAVQLVVQDCLQTDILPKMLQSLWLNWECHQTTGPNRKEPPPDWKNESNYFVILARILMVGCDVFLSVVQQWSASNDRDFTLALGHVLEEAFGNMDAVGEPAKAKLICMALTKLLETGQAFVLNKLQDLMGLWTSQIIDLRHSEADPASDSLVYTPPAGADEQLAPEEGRRSKLMYGDVVHTINLGQYVKYQLHGAIERLGGSQVFESEWLVNVDEDVTKAFLQLGIM